MQDVAPEHGRNDFAAIETIAVYLAAGGPSCVEIGTDFFGFDHANRWREKRIQCTLKLSGSKRRLRPKAAHLPERVHAGVRAPSTMELDVFLRDAAQNIHDFALNRGLVRLNLPTVEVRAV